MASSCFERLPPELELEILSYLDKHHTLFSVIQVKKAWYAYAIDRLWERPPRQALKLLTALRPLQRRQFYASKIRYLYLRNPESNYRGLVFNSLRSVTFNQGAGPTDIDHSAFIQNSLHELSYSGKGTLTAESLELARVRCTNLRSFQVFGSLSVDPGLFNDFLRSCHHLTSLWMMDADALKGMFASSAGPFAARLEQLTIHSSLRHVDPLHLLQFFRTTTVLRKLTLGALPFVVGDFLLILDTMSMLEELKITHWLTSDQLTRYLEKRSGLTPFRHLNSLSVHGEAQAVATLLPSGSITRLDLTIEDPNELIYAVIAQMVQLTHLDMAFQPAEILAREHLERLRALSKLKRLRISKVETSDPVEDLLQLPWMTDDGFKQWMSSFPLLEQLVLDWDLDGQVTEVSIDGLARSCPSLNHIMLMWTHDLRSWEKLDKPSFPKLETVGLGRIHEVTRSSYTKALKQAAPIARMIRALMPVIEDFFVPSESKLAHAISNIIRPGSVIIQADSSDDESATSSDDLEDI